MQRILLASSIVILTICVFQLPTRSVAILVNVTVDDASPNPRTGVPISYEGVWTAGQDCQGCLAQPDPERVHGGTWVDSTVTKSSATIMSASFDFTGTS